MTNADVTSRVLNGLVSLSKDDRIPKRFVLNVARSKAEFFISQKLNDRSIYKEDNLYSTVECFKLKKIEVIKCDILEFRTCKSIMRSKKKLPKLIYSKYGNSLKEITNVDNSFDFKATTPRQYRKDKDRIGEDDSVKFYVKDGYLYLLDTEVEIVNLYLITLETDKIEQISDCLKPSCKSLWEYDFIVPSKLIEPVISETIKEVSMRKNIPQDTNPNLDNNQKGKTIA